MAPSLHYPTTSSSSSSLVKRVALGAAAGALATLGLFGHHATTSFHHDATRLLTEIATAKGIEVSLRDRNGLTIRGVLLPRPAVDAADELLFDGRLSYDLAGAQYNFTLVHDRAYVTVEDLATGTLTRRACVHPENVPPISTLTDALKNGRVVDTLADDSQDRCPTGKMIEFEFAGEPYVVCAANPAHTHSSRPAMNLLGEDLSASLVLLADGFGGIPSIASLAPPNGLDLATCDSIQKSTGDQTLVAHPSAVARRLLQRTQDALQVATGGRRLSKMATTDCACKDGKKKCLFVHGLGRSAGPTTDSFPEYFGTIEKEATCCSSVKFLHIDTLNSPWYADELSEALCKEAVSMTGAKDKMAIDGLALVAHSMGNLVYQAALMNKKCALSKSSKYIALNGPMYGSGSATMGLSIFKSMAPETVAKLCAQDGSATSSNPLINALLLVGLCPTRISLASMVFKGSNQSMPELDKLLTAAGEQFGKSVTSSLCGVSATGLASPESFSISLVGSLSGHATSENDGQVHFDSCRATVAKSKYSTKWNDGKFYKASINHLDGSFRYGDGWWGDDRKPIKWFNCQF